VGDPSGHVIESGAGDGCPAGTDKHAHGHAHTCRRAGQSVRRQRCPRRWSDRTPCGGCGPRPPRSLPWSTAPPHAVKGPPASRHSLVGAGTAVVSKRGTQGWGICPVVPCAIPTHRHYVHPSHHPRGAVRWRAACEATASYARTCDHGNDGLGAPPHLHVQVEHGQAGRGLRAVVVAVGTRGWRSALRGAGGLALGRRTLTL
jgi:hypothetical protein